MTDTAPANWQHHGRYDWDHDMSDLSHGDPGAEVVRPGTVSEQRKQG